MKKILSIMLIVFASILSISSVYGKEGEIKDKLPISKVSWEDEINELNQIKCNVVIDGKSTGKTVTIHQYLPAIGDYIELRELVEALGGTITWNNPDLFRRNLGEFEIFGSKFKYESYFSKYTLIDLASGSNVSDYASANYPINLFMYDNIEDKYVHIPMSLSSETVCGKLVNNHIYISMDKPRRALPRIGYLCNVDDSSNIFNIKRYDYNAERNLMLKKFPKEKFGMGLYSKDKNEDYIVYYDSVDKYTSKYIKEPYYDDFFIKQNTTTELIELNYTQYFNTNYRSLYIQHNNTDKYYRDLFQAAYMNYYDNIVLTYDNDLNAYIISNKEFNDIDKLDKSCALLVVREFDNMVLYMK